MVKTFYKTYINLDKTIKKLDQISGFQKHFSEDGTELCVVLCHVGYMLENVGIFSMASLQQRGYQIQPIITCC